MLIAYIDEVGEAGAYVSKTHKRYNTSPAFGYAGFILPADSVRGFSRHVADVKKEIHAYPHGDASHADYNPQWERKGSEAFSKGAWRRDRSAVPSEEFGQRAQHRLVPRTAPSVRHTQPWND